MLRDFCEVDVLERCDVFVRLFLHQFLDPI